MIPIPADVLKQHVIALGKTRSAKSSKLRVLVEHILSAGQHPVIIIDPKGDWWGLKVSADGRGAGFPLVIFGGEHADVSINGESGGHIAELLCSGNRSAILDVSGMTIGERTRFFVDVAAGLFRHSKGIRYVVPDEVHNFAPKGRMFDPEAAKCLHWANRLASEGQGKGLILLAASQRPQKVHNDFLTSCETLIACKVIHKADRDAIKDWVDGCADPAAGKAVVAGVAQLKKPEAWVWSPEIDFGPRLVHWPMFSTFDSFKQQDPGDVPPTGWASVDLEDVKARLAAVVKDAVDNDPKALRARIRELESALKRGDDMGFDGGHKNGYDTGHSHGYNKGIAEGREQGAREMVSRLREPLQRYIEATQRIMANLHAMAPAPIVSAGDTPGDRIRISPPASAVSRPAVREAQSALNLGRARALRTAANGLAPVQQRILDALAELKVWYAMPAPTRQVVGFMAGYANTRSKGFANALSSLSSSGLVTYPQVGQVSLTEKGEGMALLSDAPRDSADLQRRVFERLEPVHRRILEPLIAAYPKPMPRELVAAKASYENTRSKGFSNAMSRLSSLGLVHYPRSGEVAAAPVLFREF
jgi:hypothetical protein